VKRNYWRKAHKSNHKFEAVAGAGALADGRGAGSELANRLLLPLAASMHGSFCHGSHHDGGGRIADNPRVIFCGRSHREAKCGHL